jgi:PhnB protein
MKLTTYLNYGGNCEEAFRFYEQHLGGKIVMLMKHGQQPGGPGDPELKGVLHAQIELGGTLLMGADVQASRFQPMRSAYLTMNCDTAQEAERLYALLVDGGEIFMKLEETFFAERFAMFRDRFGTSWMLIGADKTTASRA